MKNLSSKCYKYSWFPDITKKPVIQLVWARLNPDNFEGLDIAHSLHINKLECKNFSRENPPKGWQVTTATRGSEPRTVYVNKRTYKRIIRYGKDTGGVFIPS